MIKVIYNRTVDCPISKNFVDLIARTVARHEKRARGAVELTIVGEARIRRLNREWRGQDKVTDVLSFAWGERGGPASDGQLAQIYLCYRQIARQAPRFGVTAREEFARMFIHGLLHSVGYDHETKSQAKRMFGLQEKIVRLL